MTLRRRQRIPARRFGKILRDIRALMMPLAQRELRCCIPLFGLYLKRG